MTEQSRDPVVHERIVAVRSRTVVRGAESPVELSALCPVRGMDVPLDDCVHCDRGRGLRVHPDTHAVSVCCRVDEASASGRDETVSPRPPAERTTVSEIMTTHVVCVTEELAVVALEHLFLEKGISGAPVVDEAGRPLGMVSKTDLLRDRHARTPSEASARTVGDVMMPMAFCLPANESIAKAAALMAFEGVHRVPVVGVEGQVVGLVSPLDVLRWLARQSGYVIATRA